MVSLMNLNKKVMAMLEPSSYVSNMMLPELVQATREHPLGPDCIISRKEVTDHEILNTVQYYWFISHEKGCVECVVKRSLTTGEVTTHDPKCVVTKKYRRFEAYCCTLCRSNFVTVVQALLHLKAVHRAGNKILIQDKDVFHNIEKAMEVPPVPLPWHIAKKMVSEQEKPADWHALQTNAPTPPTYVIPPGALMHTTDRGQTNGPAQHATLPVAILPKSTSPNRKDESVVDKNARTNTTKAKDSDENPMLFIIMALVREFGKHIAALSFDDKEYEINISFTDGTTAVAKVPDLFQPAAEEGVNGYENLDGSRLSLIAADVEPTDQDVKDKRVVLTANFPALARRLFAEALSKGLAIPSSKEPDKAKKSGETTESAEPKADRKPAVQKSLPPSSLTAEPKVPSNRPAKSVRFMLGAPDSSDDERPDTPGNHTAVEASQNKDRTKTEKSLVTSDSKKLEERQKDEGLQNVVDELLTTASKGRIVSLPPTSPATTSTPTPSFPIVSSLPMVGSSPALSNMMSFHGEMKSKSTHGLTRVQSWTPPVGGSSPAFSVATMRRPYTARGFTYAEKIELMKQQNDYDTEFITKHIQRKAGANRNNNQNATKTSSERRKASRIPMNGERAAASGSDVDHRLPERMYSDEDKPEISDETSLNSDDDAPPTLVGRLGNSRIASFTKLAKSGLLASIFPTDYYGSGEWASQAMETLTKLQSSMENRTEEEIAQSSSRQENRADEGASFKIARTKKDSFSDEGKSSPRSSLTRTESLSDDTDSKKRLRVKLTNPSRKRCKSNESDRIPDELQSKRVKLPRKSSSSGSDDDNETRDNKRRLPSAVHPPTTKLPVSPLLNDTEKDFVKHHNVISSSSAQPPPAAKRKEHRVYQVASRSKLMGNKCSSDPALSSSTAERPQLHEPRSVSRVSQNLHSSGSSSGTTSGVKYFAKEGDAMRFKGDITIDAMSQQLHMMKLDKEKDSALFLPASDGNLPEVFRKCVGVQVEVKLVRTVLVCKVCDFVVTADTTDSSEDASKASGGSALLAHIMEHSLKELYETGYDMANL